MSKHKNKSGMTRQGVKDLSFIKGPPRGIMLPMPPGEECTHPANAMHRLPEVGYMQCGKCKTIFDEDGLEM